MQLNGAERSSWCYGRLHSLLTCHRSSQGKSGEGGGDSIIYLSKGGDYNEFVWLTDWLIDLDGLCFTYGNDFWKLRDKACT